MDNETKQIFEIIEKNHVRFDGSWLLRYLESDVNRKHLNDFNSIEQKVKLLNTILSYKFHDGAEIDVTFINLYEQLDDRIALENSYSWIETYNEIMRSYNRVGDDLLEHSCLTQTCVENSIRAMYRNRKDVSNRFNQFKRELYRRKISNIDRWGDDGNNDFSCTTFDSDQISKECSKEYLHIYYSYMGTEKISSIWNYLIPPEIRSILMKGSMDYMNSDLYIQINKVFRSENDFTMSTIHRRYLTGFLNVCQLMVFPTSLSEDIVVYRRDDYMDRSETVKTKGFYSCSLSFERVRLWNQTKRIMKIRIPAGQKFLAIGSFMNRNNEIILMPSTLLKKDRCEMNESTGILLCEYRVESTYIMGSSVRNALMNPSIQQEEIRTLIGSVRLNVISE